MKHLDYKTETISIFEYEDAHSLIMQLSKEYAGDVTVVSRGGGGRNKTEYYNYPCSFDIETTTIKPGELDYVGTDDDPPIAFPYLFQWCIYDHVIMCRTYSEAVQIFAWLSEYFRLGGNRKLVCFVHNLGFEHHFFKDLWKVIPERCFALDEHHPVTIYTEDGFIFRDSYKMTNMSLETLTKDWSRKWKKDKEIMDYSQLRTPYTELDDNTLIYSALDVLSLSDAIEAFLDARSERIWTKCPTSTSFLRAELKKEIGVSAKKRTKEQHAYHKILADQKVTLEQYEMLMRLARGGNTHANRAITGKLLHNLCHFDITSSYPAQMVCYPEFPLGPWERLGVEDTIEDIELFERNGYCCMADIALINPRLKKGVPVPYISISKMVIIEGTHMDATDNGRYMSGLEAIAVTIFGIEWPIIKAQYDFDDAIVLDGWFARKGYLPDIIRRFIMRQYAFKTQLKGIPEKAIEYALSKAALNSIFGCFYTTPLRDLWEVTEDGIELSDPGDPAEVLDKFQNSISYFAPYCWGALTAALGRCYLSRMIDAAGPENFAYCDTDSIFAQHPEVVVPKIKALEEELTVYQRRCGLELVYYDIKGRPHELGGIDREPDCEAFCTYGSKKYITVEEGKLTCTIAGVPKKKGAEIIGTAENFKIGLNFPGAVTGKNCLWYNPAPPFELHDQGRKIEVYSNVAMLPCDYLLSLSADYMECLSVEGNFHWNFKEADRSGINEEDL